VLVRKESKDLPVIAFSRGRVFGDFRVKWRACAPVLGKVLEVLSKHGVRPWNIMAHYEGDEGVSFIFADMSEVIGDVNAIIDEITALPDVLDVDFWGPQPDYVYEAFGFPTTISKTEEVIVVVLECFIEMLQGVKKYFGSSGEVFLWYLAREFGSSAAKLLDAKLEGFSVEERIKAHLALLFSSGWGRFKLKGIDLTKRFVEVKAKDIFEVRHRKSSSKAPQCLFTRGYLTGMMSTHFEVRGVRVEEVSCEAKGDDSCLFVCHLG